MTPQEAIVTLNLLLSDVRIHSLDEGRIKGAVKIVMEGVNKDIPKRPYKIWYKYAYFYRCSNVKFMSTKTANIAQTADRLLTGLNILRV